LKFPTDPTTLAWIGSAILVLMEVAGIVRRPKSGLSLPSLPSTPEPGYLVPSTHPEAVAAAAAKLAADYPLGTLTAATVLAARKAKTAGIDAIQAGQNLADRLLADPAL